MLWIWTYFHIDCFFSNAIIIFISSCDATKIVGGLYEAIFAILIFLIIPRKWIKKLDMILQKSNSPKRDLKNSIVGKLDFTSKFLLGVPKIINKISGNVFRNSSKNVKAVIKMP